MKSALLMTIILALLNLKGTGDKNLQQIKNREGIKAEIIKENLVKLKYLNGKILYKDIADYKSDELGKISYAANYDSTIIDLRTIDTSLYNEKYNFWQEVLLGGDDYLLAGDVNNNGFAEVYGLKYSTYTAEPKGITALELTPAGTFDSIYYYDSTIRARNIYDINLDGKVELDLQQHELLYPDSTMHPLLQKQLFFDKGSDDSLAKHLSFVFTPYHDENSQLDDMNFGNLDEDNKTDLIFINGSFLHLRVYEYNYNKGNFDSVYQYSPGNPVGFFGGFAIGDFDADGQKEFVIGGVHGDVQIIENTGNNQYSRIWTGKVETYNAFMFLETEDIDKNGKKEFWVGGDAYYNGLGITRFTCFESFANNSYQVVARVDLVGVFSFFAGNVFSIDVDKDGTQEIFICIDQNVIVLKFTGNPGLHSYKVFYVKQNELAEENSVYYGAEMYDLDKDGKEEILISMDQVKDRLGIKYFNFIYKQNFTTGVKDKNKIPENFVLRQNYPNPFNPRTNIEFKIPIESAVTIKVYNLLGEEIQILLEKKLSPGNYNIIWDAGKNILPISSGIYLIRMTAGTYIKTIKAVLLK